MNMKCDIVIELADQYIDAGLTDDLRARIGRHLLTCGQCAHELQSLEQARGFLREAYPAAESSPAFRERTAARLRDAFADSLAQEALPGNQWSLPFAVETDS